MEISEPIRLPRNKTGALHIKCNPAVKWEIGIDEAGRGPLFGRLYVAAVVLPTLPENDFRHDWMKDSKRFSSDKKIRQVAEYIKSNAIAWSVQYADAELIDTINIRQAVLQTMRQCIRDVLTQLIAKNESDSTAATTSPLYENVLLLVDGNDFPPMTHFDESQNRLVEIVSRTVEGGDNLYTCIAAASILAKVARDDYILELCSTHPELDEHYQLSKNKGYGTKQHLTGIQQYGITKWHRTSYKPCKAI